MTVVPAPDLGWFRRSTPPKLSKIGEGWRAVPAALALGLLVAGVWLVAHPPGWLDQRGTIATVGALWPVFGVGVWALGRVPRRTAVALVLLGGVALPLAATLGPPRTSDDLYRYEWDGRVQAAGIDPYRYPPAAPELVALRDPALWPASSAWCVENGCTLINRPTAHTIYPPVAEAYFLAVHAAPGGWPGPIQLAGAFCAAATTGLLLAAAPRLGRPGRPSASRAALWAWCPLVALEAGNGAHVDVLAALLTAGALACTGRVAIRGGLLGLAVATKLTPVLVLPALLRRRPLVLLGAAGGAVAAVYLPHVVAVGPAVLGYLPGYLREEGYTDGSRFGLLTLVLPRSWAGPAAVAVLGLVAVAVLRRSDPARPWRGALAVTGVALLLTTPTYPWYAMLLVLLVAFDGRAEWLAVAAAGYVSLYGPDRLGYEAAAAIVTAVAIGRRRCEYS
jgi:hypothetical protein